MKRLFKILLCLILFALVTITFVYLYISPIAKYAVEKNSLKWLGRQIKFGSLKVNAFDGSVFIKRLYIYEQDTSKVFFDCHDVYMKLSLTKMLANVYDIEEVRFDEPEITVTQKGNKFNFDDLIKRFSSTPAEKKASAKVPETHFYIRNVKIVNGNITYDNRTVKNVFRIHKINFDCPEFAWNTELAKLHLAFTYGTGGDFSIDAALNEKTEAYDVGLAIDKYDLSQYYAPLNSYIKISSIKGSLSTNLRMHGKFNNPKDFSMVGYLHINDIAVRDTAEKKLFAMKELLISVDTLNVKHGKYIFHQILVDEPYIVFNDYPNGNNFSRMIKYEIPKEQEDLQKAAKEHGKDTVNGKKPADYTNIFTFLESNIRNMASDYLNANYHADSISLRNGEFVFNDNTPGHKFHYTVSKINITTNEIGAKNKRVLFKASARMNDTGKFNLEAGVNYDFRKKKLDYKITSLGISHISPVAKYLLEKNSVAWVGRRVTLGHIKINAMNGSVRLNDIKIYEANGTDVFFDCHKLYVKVNLDKTFSGIYGIDTVLIDQPEITVTQNGNSFNFDDLKKRFSSTDTTKQSDSTEPVQYSIQNVIINNGNVTYTNVTNNNAVSIHNINFNLPEVSWDKPESQLHIDFEYGKGGTFNIDLTANLRTLNYKVALDVNNYNLSQYYVPLTQFLSISSLEGSLNTNLNIYGNFRNPKEISSVGYIRVNNFEMKDSTNEKVFAMDKLIIDIDTVSLKHNLYSINNILMDGAFMRFDYYPNGNNITHMIKYTSPPEPVTDSNGQVKPDYSNIFALLSSSIKLLTADFFNTNYHTDSIMIRNGQFLFNDYTLNNPFHYNISSLNLTTNEISANSKDFGFKANARLNDTGRFSMNADISLDMKNMIFNYNVTNLRVADFNPYTEYYIATPFWGGYMNYQSTDTIVNRYLTSTNVIHIEGLDAGKKTDDKPIYDLPVRTAVSLLKDDQGVIDLDLPASGNLDDPNYRVGKVVWPMISDLIIKTVASPIKLLAKTFKKDPEALKQLHFDYLEEEIQKKEIDKLDDVYTVLKKKKELNVDIIQMIDSIEEKYELALDIAKRQYYIETQHTVDSTLSRREKKQEEEAIDAIATHDSLFDVYLNKKLHLSGNELMTIEDKCVRLLGDTMLTRQVHELMAKRNQQVIDFLTTEEGLAPKRFKVYTNTDPLSLANFPEPVFFIKYKGDD